MSILKGLQGSQGQEGPVGFKATKCATWPQSARGTRARRPAGKLKRDVKFDETNSTSTLESVKVSKNELKTGSKRTRKTRCRVRKRGQNKEKRLSGTIRCWAALTFVSRTRPSRAVVSFARFIRARPHFIPAKAGIQYVRRSVLKVCGVDSRLRGNDRWFVGEVIPNDATTASGGRETSAG